MRTTSERVTAIEKRTRELQRQRRARRDFLAAGLSAAACFVLIVGIALKMPGLMAGQDAAAGAGSGAAGVFAASGAAGYVVIGLLAFALGCGVTILCTRLHRQEREKHDDRDR